MVPVRTVAKLATSSKGFDLRILIDHGQYDHLNLGDIAMLQSCITRLRREWPGAEIMVLTNSPDRLARYCPGVTGVGPAYAGIPFINLAAPSIRILLERISQTIALYLRIPAAAVVRGNKPPRTVLQAIRAADLVVASGGGYITDVFVSNASRVLRVLRVAQSLGKHTAMFGQGLGPIERPVLRKLASAVFPRLSTLGLREDRAGAALAASLGADPNIVSVTGDDALEGFADRGCADGAAIGVNIRVADYSGVDPANAAMAGDIILKTSIAYAAPVVGLPISRQPTDSDLAAIKELSRRPGWPTDAMLLSDLDSPADLVTSAAQCRIIVTGSYHAAVFGLAQGIPAVCLTRSAYYDGKFSGLKSLFPAACFIVPLAADDFGDRLSKAINDAWNLPVSTRSATRGSALAQCSAGRKAYRQFREIVENGQLDRSAVVAAG